MLATSANKDTFTGTGFKDFMLKSELMRTINDNGFEQPSEVQEQALAPALMGRDCLCQAKSGMGKTMVFVLTVLQQIDLATKDKNRLQCLVFAPTRELAMQISDEFKRMSKYMPELVMEVIHGKQGRNKTDEVKKSNPHVIIGCPGRIKDYVVDMKVIKLDKLRFFVVDECDKILENLGTRSTSKPPSPLF